MFSAELPIVLKVKIRCKFRNYQKSKYFLFISKENCVVECD